MIKLKTWEGILPPERLKELEFEIELHIDKMRDRIEAFNKYGESWELGGAYEIARKTLK